jgi:hypothetical protein
MTTHVEKPRRLVHGLRRGLAALLLAASAPAAAQLAEASKLTLPSKFLGFCPDDSGCDLTQVCRLPPTVERVSKVSSSPTTLTGVEDSEPNGLSAGERSTIAIIDSVGRCIPDTVKPKIDLEPFPERRPSCGTVRLTASVADNRWLAGGQFFIDGAPVLPSLTFSGRQVSVSRLFEVRPEPQVIELLVWDAANNTAIVSATVTQDPELLFCDSFDVGLGVDNRFYRWARDYEPDWAVKNTRQQQRPDDPTGSHLTVEWQPFDYRSGFRSEIHMRTLRSGPSLREAFYKGDLGSPNGAAQWSEQDQALREQWYSWFVYVDSQTNDLYHFDGDAKYVGQPKYKGMHLMQFHSGNLDDKATKDVREQTCAPMIGLGYDGPYDGPLPGDRVTPCSGVDAEGNAKQLPCLTLTVKELERIDDKCKTVSLGRLPIELDSWVQVVQHIVWSDAMNEADWLSGVGQEQTECLNEPKPVLETWLVYPDGTVRSFEWVGTALQTNWARDQRMRGEDKAPLVYDLSWVTNIDPALNPRWEGDCVVSENNTLPESCQLVGVGTRFHLPNTYRWPNYLKLGQYLHFVEGSTKDEEGKSANFSSPENCTVSTTLADGTTEENDDACHYRGLVHYDELRIGLTPRSVGFAFGEELTSGSHWPASIYDGAPQCPY